jgi:hypothetical protein
MIGSIVDSVLEYRLWLKKKDAYESPPPTLNDALSAN